MWIRRELATDWEDGLGGGPLIITAAPPVGAGVCKNYQKHVFLPLIKYFFTPILMIKNKPKHNSILKNYLAWRCDVGGGGNGWYFLSLPASLQKCKSPTISRGLFTTCQDVINLNLVCFWWKFLHNEVKNEKSVGFRWSKKNFVWFFCTRKDDLPSYSCSRLKERIYELLGHYLDVVYSLGIDRIQGHLTQG